MSLFQCKACLAKDKEIVYLRQLLEKALEAKGIILNTELTEHFEDEKDEGVEEIG